MVDGEESDDSDDMLMSLLTYTCPIRGKKQTAGGAHNDQPTCLRPSCVFYLCFTVGQTVKVHSL